MKRFIVIAMVMLCLLLIGCEDDVDRTGQAKTPSGSSAMQGRDYSAVQKTFEEEGFTNITIEPIDDLITGWLTKDGEVEKVSVGGDENYASDRWVDADTEVIIYYHTFSTKQEDSVNNITSEEVINEETKVQSDVENSNTEQLEEQEEAEKVLAYVDRGDEYWTYYLIDFDEGTVRCFFTNDTGVYKATIESGNLNDGLIIKYSIGGDERTETLHWHYTDNDSTLIVNDPNGFTFKFQKADVDSAKKVLKQDGYYDYE